MTGRHRSPFPTRRTWPPVAGIGLCAALTVAALGGITAAGWQTHRPTVAPPPVAALGTLPPLVVSDVVQPSTIATDSRQTPAATSERPRVTVAHHRTPTPPPAPRKGPTVTTPPPAVTPTPTATATPTSAETTTAATTEAATTVASGSSTEPAGTTTPTVATSPSATDVTLPSLPMAAATTEVVAP